MMTGINGREFLDVICPLLEEGKADRIAHAVTVRWTSREVCRLLDHHNADVRKVAAMVLGLTGGTAEARCLARALRDCDPQVNEMAEHALWSIWFRAGNASAAEVLHDGMALMAEEKHEQAITKLEQATRIDPQFAEAFNQCAIAHFFIGDWEASIAQARKAIELVPYHFAAIAGLGHCYMQQGNLSRAARCYRRALEIHPRMDVIRDALGHLEAQKKALDESGEFVALRG